MSALLDAASRLASRLAAGLAAPLAPLAAGAPAPVFAVAGAGARDRVEELALDRRVELVASPRHASVLLVAGAIPRRCGEALKRLHDQLPYPRGTLLWDLGGGTAGGVDWNGGGDGPQPARVNGGGDPAAAAAALHRGLLDGFRASEVHLLPDQPPAPWRGRGDHGQGGEGMMGGKPYGRPMAMTAADLRDGLALDRLELRFGPFFPHFPPGLVLEVALQGDLVQEAEVIAPPFEQPLPEPFRRRREQPVPTAELEAARAAALLRSVARVLRAAGASALADRALGCALRPLEAGGAPVRALAALLRRGGALATLPSAAGTRDLLRGRLEGAAAALDRAAASAAAGGTTGGSRDSTPARRREREGKGDPRTPAEADLKRLAHRLAGLEWGDAVLVVAGFDPVLAALGEPRTGAPGGAA